MNAPRSFGAIVDHVFVERGGAPLHFFLEHFTLAWPGELEGLRLPSLLAFLLTLPAAALVGRELAGPAEAFFAALALALAPLAVRMATFGRMYGLFLALALWAFFAALWAGRRGGTVRWALAGALLGSLVYVHPIAPLYGGLGLLAGFVHSELPVRRLVREAWAAVATFVLAGVPYYLHSLTVLRDRYDIATAGAPRLRATRGQSIPEATALSLTPGGRVAAVAFILLAVAGLTWIAWRRWRSALVLGLWVVGPLVFFWAVPIGGLRLFDRYLIPVLPAFLLLVVAGCLAASRLVPRVGVAVSAVLLAGVLGWQGLEDLRRLDRLRDLRLPDLVEAVEGRSGEGVLFSSTGTPTAGRPPELLNEHVALEVPAIPAVEERYERDLAAFLARGGERRVGLWVFRGEPGRVGTALERLRAVEGVAAERISAQVLLVRSTAAGDPRALLELGTRVRSAWSLGEPTDRRVEALIAVDRKALAGQSSRE